MGGKEQKSEINAYILFHLSTDRRTDKHSKFYSRVSATKKESIPFARHKMCPGMLSDVARTECVEFSRPS